MRSWLVCVNTRIAHVRRSRLYKVDQSIKSELSVFGKKIGKKNTVRGER